MDEGVPGLETKPPGTPDEPRGAEEGKAAIGMSSLIGADITHWHHPSACCCISTCTSLSLYHVVYIPRK